MARSRLPHRRTLAAAGLALLAAWAAGPVHASAASPDPVTPEHRMQERVQERLADARRAALIERLKQSLLDVREREAALVEAIDALESGGDLRDLDPRLLAALRNAADGPPAGPRHADTPPDERRRDRFADRSRERPGERPGERLGERRQRGGLFGPLPTGRDELPAADADAVLEALAQARPNLAESLVRLRERDPERFERLWSVRGGDIARLVRATPDDVESLRQQRRELRAELRQVEREARRAARQIARAADTPTDGQADTPGDAAPAELAQIVSRGFDLHMRLAQLELTHFTERLDAKRAEIATRQAEKDRHVRRLTAELIEDAADRIEATPEAGGGEPGPEPGREPGPEAEPNGAG